MEDRFWEFWIDVGGTFTDCFALAPNGSLRRHKLLSSGVTKGAVGAGSSSGAILDAARRNDPSGFWSGARLRLLDTAGGIVAESNVINFAAEAGALRLEPALDPPSQSGQAYELTTGDDAPVLAVRYLLGLAAGVAIPAFRVRLGT